MSWACGSCRRHVEHGWSIKQMRAELGMDREWLVDRMARLGRPTMTIALEAVGPQFETRGAATFELLAVRDDSLLGLPE